MMIKSWKLPIVVLLHLNENSAIFSMLLKTCLIATYLMQSIQSTPKYQLHVNCFHLSALLKLSRF